MRSMVEGAATGTKTAADLTNSAGDLPQRSQRLDRAAVVTAVAAAIVGVTA